MFKFKIFWFAVFFLSLMWPEREGKSIFCLSILFYLLNEIFFKLFIELHNHDISHLLKGISQVLEIVFYTMLFFYILVTWKLRVPNK